MSKLFPLALGILFIVTSIGCDVGEKSDVEILPRESKISTDAVKMTPQTDYHPPILYSDEWEEPVPLPYPVNTAGAEDSPFIMPDGNTLYFFFTPDPAVPVEKQLIDGH